MINIKITEVDERTLMIEIIGELLPGSAGNVEAQKINSTIQCLPEQKTQVILNLLDLDYSSGDYFGSIFISLVQRHFKFSVVAKGKTRESLQNLIQYSNMDQILTINFYEDTESALSGLKE